MRKLLDPTRLDADTVSAAAKILGRTDLPFMDLFATSGRQKCELCSTYSDAGTILCPKCNFI